MPRLPYNNCKAAYFGLANRHNFHPKQKISGIVEKKDPAYLKFGL